MVGKKNIPKVRCLIKAYLLSHPGKHTSREISDWITRNDFGIYRGVTPTEVGVLIKEATMPMVQSARKHPNSGHKVYWIEQRGGK